MQLKLYLNKIIKVDNIEGYNLSTIMEIQNAYTSFLENSDGYDPDFPMSGTKDKHGNGDMQNIKIKGTNVYANFDEDNPDPNFEGIPRSAIAKAKMNSGNIKSLYR